MAVLKSPARAWRFLKSGFDWYVGFQGGLAAFNYLNIALWIEPNLIGFVSAGAFALLATWNSWEATKTFCDNRKVRAARRELQNATAPIDVVSLLASFSTPANTGTPLTTYALYSAYQRLMQSAYANQANTFAASWTSVYPGEFDAPAAPQRPTASVDSLPEEGALIRGWRTYTVNEQGQLKGSRAVWESATFEAKCSGQDVVADHLLNGCADPDGTPRGGFGCGIYSHKTGPEYLDLERLDCHNPASVTVVAQCISSGVVAEHEFGYRAEKCRIEQMWLIVPRGCGKHQLKLAVPDQSRHTCKPERDLIKRAWVCSCGRAISDVALSGAGNPLDLFRSVMGTSVVPRWECSNEAVANPGAAYAQVLSTKYGVPCTAIGVAEFLAKLDEGSL